MKTCTQCAGEVPDQLVCCPSCGAPCADEGPSPELDDKKRRHAQTRPHQPSPLTRGMTTARVKPPKKVPWGGLAVVVAGIFLAIWIFKPKPFPEGVLVTEGGEMPCAATHRCVVAYITPSCPACRQSIPMLKRFEKAWPEERGLVVILGGQRGHNQQRMVKVLDGLNLVIDADSSIAKKLDISTVPTWFTLNETGRITNRLSGTYPSPEQHEFALDLD